jgi:hypothetical protein
MSEKLMKYSHGSHDAPELKKNFSPHHVTYYSGLVSEEPIAEAVTVGELLSMNSDGNLEEADLSTGVEKPAKCMALGEGSEGDTIPVLWVGRLRNDDWSWTPGDAIYAGANGDAGSPTQDLPDDDADLVQVIGFAISATAVLFRPDWTAVAKSTYVSVT